jgi:hypothetical protein
MSGFPPANPKACVNKSRRTVRFSADTDARLVTTAKERGFTCPTAFIRAAIEREIRHNSGETAVSLEAIANTLDRLTTENFRLVRAQQALFAFLDSLAKILLTCIPEPAGEAVDPAVARGRLRYDRLIKAAGRAMSGDAKAAMHDLIQQGSNNGD